jgi:ketosteroid isomerase-like protein
MKPMQGVAIAILFAVTAAQAAEKNAAPEAAAPAAATPTTATAPAMSAAECQVWNREVGFAMSVQRHDAKAFAEHLHPGAVFLGGTNKPRRGSESIAQAWAGIVKGEGGVLHWHPDTVVIGGDPNVALSRGPWWIADTSRGAKQPFLLGNYVSTWVRGSDGVWHVLFDGGGGNQPVPASAEDISKLVSAFPAVCQ